MKPLSNAYPSDPRTVGDHLRKRRLDLGLFQKDVAERVGVDVCSVTNWELNRTEPEIRYMPAILDFLGFVPFDTGGTFGERVRTYRMCNGVSQEKLAEELRIDAGTLRKWEAEESQPSRKLQARVEEMIRHGLNESPCVEKLSCLKAA